MDNPAGFGGILLIIAALAWLVVFVPGYASRAELSARTSMVRRSQKEQNRNIAPTPQQRLIRLTNTQRGFSILFALLFVASLTLGTLSVTVGMPWVSSIVTLLLSLGAIGVSRSAARAAEQLAQSIYVNRERVRNTAARRVSSSKSRDWVPNPLPAPLAQNLPKQQEQIAEVINISSSARSISSKELDEILARRRAI